MKTLWDNGASQNISFYSRVPNKRGGGSNKQDKQGDWKCMCVCVYVCVCWVGVCVDGG